jgi:hypothetical protein
MVLHVLTLLGHLQATHLLKGTLLHCIIPYRVDCYQHTVFSFCLKSVIKNYVNTVALRMVKNIHE